MIKKEQSELCFDMDSRIQALLASIDQQDSEDEGERRLREDSPPRSLEDFLAKGLDWPSTPDDFDDQTLSVDTVGLGTLEEIREDLSSYAPFDISLLDDVQRQIEELETRIHNFGLLKEEELLPAGSHTTASSKHVLSPTSMRAISAEHPDEVINKKENIPHRFGFTEEQSSIVKSIQYTSYPGFFANEMTPLPGQLEAPQLLNKVIKAQNVLPEFRKVLNKLFLSEASVAIIQDTFWWFFLRNFQTEGSKSAQDGLFNRVADSFVALFFGVPPQYKDRFFMNYPDCLAQAVYAAFCEAFPRSYSLFDDNFKNNLLNLISEWITGTRPPPQSWKKWNFNILEPANIRELQDDRTQSLKANMVFDVETALEGVLPPDDASRHGKERGTMCGPLSATKPPVPKEVESHEIGPGPEFERDNFNIFGRSPLVSHYLKMKELSSGEVPVQAISRTEISKQQAPAPTYKQIIDETKKAVKLRNINYQKVLELSTQESIKIQRQKQKALKKLDKLKTDLVLKNQDIKAVSDKLMDLVTQADYASVGYATSSQTQDPLDHPEERTDQ